HFYVDQRRFHGLLFMQAEVFLYDQNTEANDFYNKKLRGGCSRTLSIMDSLLPTPGTLITTAVCLHDRPIPLR
ncbi:hypothetical protein ACTVNK_21505, partial [Serratia nevei]